jgi:tRNA pseudouridine38-40 synthase
LEYDGSHYRGWQVQDHAPSVQGELQKALSFVADQPITVITAGRTDTGVHASTQVVHFDAPFDRGERSWVLGANSRLPRDISAQWARVVPAHFHARYSALARSYRYIIHNRSSRPAIMRERACWVREPLDAARMHAAAQQFCGTHDFSTFRAAECQSHSPIRRLESISVRRTGEYLAIDVTANAFLHHMVRNIAGVLIAIGCGDQPIDWVSTLLAARDRRVGGVTAVPQGLYLIGVRYAPEFGLPSEPEVLDCLGGRLPDQPGPRIDALDSSP